MRLGGVPQALLSVLNVPDQLSGLLVGKFADCFKVAPRDYWRFGAEVLQGGLREDFFLSDSVSGVTTFFEKSKNVNTPFQRHGKHLPQKMCTKIIADKN